MRDILLKWEILGNHSIIIQVGKHGTETPGGSRRQACLSNLGECSVPVVAIETIGSSREIVRDPERVSVMSGFRINVIGNVNVEVAIVIHVGEGRADRDVATTADTRLGTRGGKPPISAVDEERVRPGSDEVDIRIPVTVDVTHGETDELSVVGRVRKSGGRRTEPAFVIEENYDATPPYENQIRIAVGVEIAKGQTGAPVR